MTATFVVYVDESGDEGFRFGEGSSEWFVLSAVITRKATDLGTVRLVDRVRAQLDKPDKRPLHFRDLRHEHRLPFVDAIARARLRTVSVLVHKPSLLEPGSSRNAIGSTSTRPDTCSSGYPGAAGITGRPMTRATAARRSSSRTARACLTRR